ncbi:L-threonylcarbamoyladenylate synthase [Aquabacterium sp. OR-4]|uniref:L-threonylcarbamoyladenylate synthase n=1 Tax=Aquabacterium sp. OR-4 TaxID=2978127 RepID=UPI0021B3CCC2|nr:L-threonylcarbamoyladenylate synthase [Aquabacterium sp. OR-4]MDT7837424.1 L-threonylcarbamoyladenylate synthase [Aquabacterium sp. OR-4]
MSILRGDDPAALAAAAERLAAGALVGLPTETVYGLGARADDDAAVARIFAAKGRPADHPLIVHVADAAAAAFFAADALPPAARRLMAAFWPGPVTVIVPRRDGVAAASAGGQASIGLRCPSHPVAQALLRAAAARGVPGVSAPSANRFGRVSPTCAAHVASEFGPELLVLDGGDCDVGIESAIVDVSRGHPVLLRPGALPREALEAALGQPLQAPDADAPRASGTLASHYAPAARVRLFAPEALSRALAAALCTADTCGPQAPEGVAVYSRQPVAGPQAMAASGLWRPMPADPAAVAHELFAVLRALDVPAVREIWIEQPPDLPAWEGVRDRLRRAAADPGHDGRQPGAVA